jgi:hypothetical protein
VAGLTNVPICDNHSTNSYKYLVNFNPIFGCGRPQGMETGISRCPDVVGNSDYAFSNIYLSLWILMIKSLNSKKYSQNVDTVNDKEKYIILEKLAEEKYSQEKYPALSRKPLGKLES